MLKNKPSKKETKRLLTLRNKRFVKEIKIKIYTPNSTP